MTQGACFIAIATAFTFYVLRKKWSHFRRSPALRAKILHHRAPVKREHTTSSQGWGGVLAFTHIILKMLKFHTVIMT